MIFNGKVSSSLSSRLSFLIAVIMLMIGAVLRVYDLATLPVGFSNEEFVDVWLIETIREGNISVFYDLGGEGREGLYHILQVLFTSFVGDGLLGFRILSVWTNMLALAIIYAAGKRLFGRVAGLGALGLMTASFWPVLLSRQVTPETAIPFLVSSILLTISTVLPIYRRRVRRGDNTTTAAALGFFLGVSLYVHPIGLLLVLFAFTFITYMILTRQRMSRRRVSYLSFAVLVMIIVSMPYMISTIRVPQLGGMERLTGERLNLSFRPVVDSLVAFVADGDTNPLHNLPGRPMFDPITVILILIGLIAAIRKWRMPRNTMLIFGLAIFAPVFLMAAHAPDYRNYSASLPLLALLFGSGLHYVSDVLFDKRNAQRIGLAIVAGIVVLNIVLTGRDLFVRWKEDPNVYTVYNGQLGQLAHYADVTSDEIATVICGWTLDPGAQPSDSSRIELMMHREKGNIRFANCNKALVMTNGGEPHHVILPDPTVLETTHPQIRHWLEQGVEIVEPDLPGNSVLLMDVETALADRVGEFTVTTPVNYGPEVSNARDLVIPPPVSFSNNLTFLGYVPDDSNEYSAGDIFTLVTYWRIQKGGVPSDLRLFTHILSDPGASPPANTDTIHVEPRLLADRDVIVQVTRVPLPESLPEGRYVISIGAYQDESDLRLDVLENGETRGTRLFLFGITVKANS